MAATINSPASCELRSVIRFLQAEGCSAAEIHRRMSVVYGEHCMSDSAIRKWCRLFAEGRTDVHDEGGQGRKSVATASLVERVDQAIREKRRFTIDELSTEFPAISRSSLYKIVTTELGYRKLCARWVPKMLSEDHKTKRMASALTFLTRYDNEKDSFLKSIVTGDETWVLYENPETKEQSKQWMHTHSPSKPKKFKQTLTKRKTMATVFWDQKGVLLVEFMQQGTTITKESYCETLHRLRRAIQNKRRGMLSSGVVLIHDNARPHSANVTKQLLQKFKWEVFDHPPYSPDLAPSDYHLFREMKAWLGGRRFADNEELQATVRVYLSSLAADFFEEGIGKLVSRYDKCLNIFGDYVEK
uniref:Mos1 transposase HTH domain-containing protein n=1 Tax=Homalodisca liturata TaxID=320908 RepID=A0A1B6H603_9HEMI